MKEIYKNWRNLLLESKAPKDFHYRITTSPTSIEIHPLDLNTKQYVAGKSKESDEIAELTMKKRTDLPYWEVAWSNSPAGSEGVGTVIYLIALELAGNEGLGPDSIDTSEDALRIWYKFMLKNNRFGVSKEKKEEYQYENDKNPFFFVFYKPNQAILEYYRNQISFLEKKVEKIAQKEPEIAPFDPHDPLEWEDIDDINENLDIKAKDTKNVAKVLIFNKNNEILLLKRADKRKNWDLPGGHVKKGENYKNGAERETKEETNLDILVLKHIKTQKKGRIIQYFKTNSYEGSISLDPEEHVEYKWVKIEDLGKFPVIKRMKTVIKAEMKNILQEVEPYQQKVKKKHPRMKLRLIGDSKRSKSSPPGFGGV